MELPHDTINMIEWLKGQYSASDQCNWTDEMIISLAVKLLFKCKQDIDNGKTILIHESGKSLRELSI